MANKVPVKAIFSGSDVSSLGEFATSDTIAASYINGVPTGSLALAGGTMTGNIAHGGAFTIDTVGDISLDSEGAILIKNGGSAVGRISNSNSDMIIKSDTSDKDILFKGNDGGSTITALSLDMSSAGKATFNASVTAKTDTDTSNTGSVTLDFTANQNFVLTLTGNVTLANPSTEAVGQSGFIAFIQDGTGSRTVALGTDYETPAAAGLTLTSTASATDLVPYLVVASNRILLGTPQLAFA